MAMNNSLAEVHPELVAEWSERNLPLTPDKITYGSNKIVWWINIRAIIRYCRSERVTAHQRSLFMKSAALPVLILSRISLLIIMTTRFMMVV